MINNKGVLKFYILLAALCLVLTNSAIGNTKPETMDSSKMLKEEVILLKKNITNDNSEIIKKQQSTNSLLNKLSIQQENCIERLKKPFEIKRDKYDWFKDLILPFVTLFASALLSIWLTLKINNNERLRQLSSGILKELLKVDDGITRLYSPFITFINDEDATGDELQQQINKVEELNNDNIILLAENKYLLPQSVDVLSQDIMNKHINTLNSLDKLINRTYKDLTSLKKNLQTQEEKIKNIKEDLLKNYGITQRAKTRKDLDSLLRKEFCRDIWSFIFRKGN